MKTLNSDQIQQIYGGYGAGTGELTAFSCGADIVTTIAASYTDNIFVQKINSFFQVSAITTILITLHDAANDYEISKEIITMLEK